MKRNLLTVGALLLSFVQIDAQFVSYVGKNAQVNVKEGALVSNYGGINVVQDGKINNSGDIMVVGNNTTSEFKTAGKGHFVLTLNDVVNYTTSTYGQLYITGFAQSKITGVVDKEYRATKNGSMQQMALPFHTKALSDLAGELGIAGGFSDRRDLNAVGYFENRNALMHNLVSSASTSVKADRDDQQVLNSNAARYYAIGTKNWDPAAKVHTITGVPYADAIDGTSLRYILRNGGNVEFGAGGENRNVYRERYKTYIEDEFVNTYFAGDYGKNYYQFANPFLVNIDLAYIGYQEQAKDGQHDGNAISNIQGIRYEALGVTENVGGVKGTRSSNVAGNRYITFAGGKLPVGDIDKALIKPMGAFVIKLRDNTSDQILDFNKLRRFAYKARVEGTETSATVASKKRASANKVSGNTVKQLRVIGLDGEGNEVMRTYYVVSNEFINSISEDARVQVATYNENLSTREELISYEGNEKDQYRLYINEANEVDYIGKPIELLTNTDKIKSYKFELAENAKELGSGQSAFIDGGNSFYIEQANGIISKISHEAILPATTNISKLYYGKPVNGTLNTIESNLNSEFNVAYNKAGDNFKVIFPQNWKTAVVSVYDMAGRLILKSDRISNLKDYYLSLDKGSTYIVVAVSDNGEKVSKKIINQ